MRGMSTTPRQVPLAAEPGQEQLRLIAGKHRPALIVGAEIAVGRRPAKALDGLAFADRLVARLVRLAVCGSPIVTAPAIELPNSRSIRYRSVGSGIPRRSVSR